MKNILLAKEMPLHSKNTIILSKEFRTRDSLFNMDFCSRIIKHYLEFSGYDELIANMVFLDMYKNGSNSVDIVHDKEVLFFQNVLVSQPTNYMPANIIEGLYHKSSTIQNRIINQQHEKEKKILDKRQNQVRIPRTEKNILVQEWIQKIEKNISVQEQIQKIEKNVLIQEGIESREAYWNSAVFSKHIFQKQLANLLMEKKELLQENTVNFVTDKNIQYQDNHYKDNKIKYAIGYTNWYQGEQIKQIQERRIVHQSIKRNHVTEYTEKYQNTPIKYINITRIEGQSGMHQAMQSRLLFHVIQQKNQIQAKYYIQTGNHVQANTIAGLYKKSSKIQNRIINQLLEEKNKILNKRQNQVRIQRTEKNILVQEWIQKIEKNISVQEQIQKIEKNVSIQEGIESREAYWNSAVFLKHIFQKQLANLLMEKKELLQENTVNFVTDKNIQYQDNHYKDNKIKYAIGYTNWYQGEQIKQIQERRIVHQSIKRNHVTEYTEKYQNTSKKYINITRIEEQSGTYWDNWINFSIGSENIHQVNPISYIEKQKSLHQVMQSRLLFHVIHQKNRIQTKNYIQTGNHVQANTIAGLYKKSSKIQNRIINQLLEEKNKILNKRQNQERIPKAEGKISAQGGMESRFLSHVIHQKNRIQTKNYTQTGNHVQANTIAGLYKKSSKIQNRIINQLLEEKNKILNKRQNQERIPKAEGKISTQEGIESREAYWNSAVFLKHIFQKQLANLLMEKKELLQDNIVNFVTDKKIQYQDNHYKDNKIKYAIGYTNWYQGEQIKQIQERRIVHQSIQRNHVIEYTEKYQNTSKKYINITRIEEQSGTYWDNWINFSIGSKNIHQVNPISYIEKQKILHQSTQSSKIQNRIINQLLEEKNEILDTRQNQIQIQRTEKNILVQEWIQKIEKNISVQEQIQKTEKNVSIQGAMESREIYWNSAVFLKHIFQKQLANLLMEKKELLQDNIVNFVTDKKIQYQDNHYKDNKIRHIIEYANWYQGKLIRQIQERKIVHQSGTYSNDQTSINERSKKLHQVNQLNAMSITFRKDFYKNNAIMSVPGNAFDLWGINQTALKTATGLEQTVEKENYYSRDRIYAKKSNISDKILSEVRCQIGDAIEKSQEDLAGERQKSADREKILKILEERVQQQEAQIKELKIMCKEFYKQQEEDKDNQVRKEKYLEVFNNDWKLERMRYGVL